ncbi:fumarylacetoacetate hydrolase family protein [Variovorax sp. PCZ-1]|uniref:fumarylacetoacetate hydrolase family protein n=1 Tax=Variovorax sp. PCZ-1 TaxID=2835533 RepID=UPI001BCAD979|nr:fumarylacetoacetate hydrolase family protein [Variovorax sp. PCZ-1]MBS7806022.1 fumarylacetoacetate hydrolase family protein [Variovorax sp. PCZ-1]
MRLASWSWGGQPHVGTVSSDGQELTALDVSRADRGVLPVLQGLVRGEALPASKGTRLPVSAVQLHAPMRKPLRSLICVGRNYRAHAAELAGSVFTSNANDQMQWPIVFTKLAECVVGPHDDVLLPGAQISEQIDYESELAVVIGKGGKNISAARAMEHVFGYTVVNDVTARDVQMRHSQWDLGKSFDTFCPMGPWIVTADELQHDNIRVRGWVNGELRQDGNTKDLIFNIPNLIETCSRGITLMPGDVIATGTPAGVGMGMKPPRYLKSGDVVRVEIDGIGAIENRFV